MKRTLATIISIATTTSLSANANSLRWPFIHDSEMDRAASPGNTESYFIVNGAAVGNISKHINVDALLEKYNTIFSRAAGNPGARELLIEVDIEDLEKARTALSTLGDNRLSLEAGNETVSIYYQKRDIQGFPPNLKADLHDAIGIIHHKIKQYDKARNAYFEALQTAPTEQQRARIRRHLAQTLIAENKSTEAAKQFISAALSEKNAECEAADYQLAALADNHDHLQKAQSLVPAVNNCNTNLSAEVSPPLSILGGGYDGWRILQEFSDSVEQALESAQQSGDAEANHYRSLLAKMLSKPALVSIQGTLLLPKDVRATHTVIEGLKQTEKIGDEDMTFVKSKEDNSPDVDKQPVYLCKAAAYDRFMDKLKQAALKKHSSIESFARPDQSGWPSIHDESVELLSSIQSALSSAVIERVSTGKTGDFQFKPVPKGCYYIFSWVDNNESVTFWFIKITANRAGVITTDLSQASATGVLWTKSGSTVKRSRQEILPPDPKSLFRTSD